jgi:hypothetical protein
MCPVRFFYPFPFIPFTLLFFPFRAKRGRDTKRKTMDNRETVIDQVRRLPGFQMS